MSFVILITLQFCIFVPIKFLIFFQIEMEQLMEMLQAQMAAQRLSDSLDLSDAAAEMLGQYFRSLLQYFFTSGCAPNK